MVNGTNVIWNYLDRNSDIKRNLSRGLINIRSLAKHVLDENHELELGVKGVATAISRYVDEKNFKGKEVTLHKIFGNTKIEMHSGNTILHINKTEHSLSALTELFKRLNLIGEDNVSLVMDKSSFALVFDNEHHHLIQSQFQEDKVLNELKDVGQIVLRFDPAVLETPNVFASILNELGINEINILDSISKRERFMIFVNEKDLMNTCNVLYKFTKQGRKVKAS